MERLDRVLRDARQRPLADPLPVRSLKGTEPGDHPGIIGPCVLAARLHRPLDIDRREPIQRDAFT